MNTHKTDYVLLFVITACASLATIFILSKISYEVDTVSPQQETTIMRSESTPLATFNALVAQGWKVYRDEEKNIEFAYPKDWILENSDKASVLITSNNNKELDFYLGVMVNENLVYKSLDDFIEQNIDKKSEYQLESKSIRIDDTLGDYRIIAPFKSDTLYSSENEILYNHIFITVLKGNLIYSISGEQSVNSKSEYETQFNQILSSFHFLK